MTKGHGVTLILIANVLLVIVFAATSRNPLPLSALIFFSVPLLVLPMVFVSRVGLAGAVRDARFIALVGMAIFWIPAYFSAYPYDGPAPELVGMITDAGLVLGFLLFIASAYMRWFRPDRS